MAPEFVSTPEALISLCERLAGARRIYLDTEFVRVRTYYPVLCLIQISDGSSIHCIDTIAIEDLSALMNLIDSRPDAMTLHAGRQDFEALFQRTGRLPGAVWDTQIAAAMLDMGDQVSYAQLVKELANVELPKGHTRTNWAKRPLSEGQLRYAADDVLYLADIRAPLEARLDALGRTDWHAEDCRALLDESLYVPACDQAWRRCKLRGRLSPAQRGAWKTLCELRERKAAETDRPRRWVLEDNALEELAVLSPDDNNRIASLLASGRIRRELDVDQVRAALTDPVPATDNGGSRPDATQMALIDRCLARVRNRAESLGISASLLATRKDVTQLVRGDRDVGILRGWRAEVIGDELLAGLE